MIVITTPTGQIGSHVVRHCIERGEPIRVVARDPSSLPGEIRDRVEVVQGSHGDAAVIEKALAGADALFWLVPPEPHSASIEAHYLDFTRPACDAIRRHGVGHVVDVKAIAAGTPWQERAGLATVSQRMDELLAATGASLRGLAAPALMENMLMQLGPIMERGTFFGPVDPQRKLPQVATRDIGAVAARLLCDRSWSGQKDMTLLGPEDLSFDDMAAIMATVLGRPVRYQQVSFEDFAAQLRDRGMPPSFVAGFVDMMKAKNEGLDNAPARTAETTTPTTFRQWCEEELTAAVKK